MSVEQKQLIEFAIQDLVGEVSEKEGLSIADAMDVVYHSDFFRKLIDASTGLYRESGGYLYACFRK